MKVYELMVFLAEQQAGAEVLVSISEDDNRTLLDAGDHLVEEGVVLLQSDWPEEADS